MFLIFIYICGWDPKNALGIAVLNMGAFLWNIVMVEIQPNFPEKLYIGTP
jgi:hypothetical protein